MVNRNVYALLLEMKLQSFMGDSLIAVLVVGAIAGGKIGAVVAVAAVTSSASVLTNQ